MQSYAGAQKNGIRDEHPIDQSAHEHVLLALQAPFFLAQSTPLPDSAKRAIRCVARSDPTAVRAFWEKQLARL